MKYSSAPPFKVYIIYDGNIMAYNIAQPQKSQNVTSDISTSQFVRLEHTRSL